ncbi:LLM class flavin-dependent oxidoreductase [Aurantibacillus circumpalustris]|uniref:LLM class flavin-dependent oxidoreductase n=1 Tax=Aurantibacillus circumpalustris TaxID=3036359 RepID=UPI00295BFBB5|nr:LLM class flavin-dependent oxidoreductase [Aurantibacillus circumpalustris]
MMTKLKLGILDQSIVHYGKTAKNALDETIATVKLAEELGYSRFWVSEHHNSTFIAGSAPEILMVKLASETKHIRIGSGGVMLPNHSTLKVAENFRLLETLFPGRIDLGMGRAPGGDKISASLLNPSNTFSEESYLKQLDNLQRFFSDSAATLYGPLIAVPKAETTPEQWILSSSGGSAAIAAKFGLGLAVARFINGFAAPEIAANYRKNFKPSKHLTEPKVLLAISVLCADTEEKSLQMRKYIDYVLLQFERGKFDGFGTPDEIAKHSFSMEELERIKNHKGRIVSGTKEQVKDQLLKLADEFKVDEIMVTVMANNSQDRKRSFELLADAFDLAKQNLAHTEKA